MAATALVVATPVVFLFQLLSDSIAAGFFGNAFAGGLVVGETTALGGGRMCLGLDSGATAAAFTAVYLIIVGLVVEGGALVGEPAVLITTLASGSDGVAFLV